VVAAADVSALAHGGGGGGGWDSRHKVGLTGGSSGGTCQKISTRTEPTKSKGEMGNAGGAASSDSPGGGGGATAAGGDGTSSGAAGSGGEGYACSISGTSQVYGSGGGGGLGNTCNAVGAGGTNAGAGGGGVAVAGFGGGGGGGTHRLNNGCGGNGGCGTVILSFSSVTAVANRFTVADIPNQAATGSAVEPLPVVKDKTSGATLTAGTDYAVTYENNTAVGLAYAIVTGMGNYANNRWSVPFNIVPAGNAKAKWFYADGVLTEIVPCESLATPWTFTLTAAGVLTRTTLGGSTELDLGDDALPTNAPAIRSVAATAFNESRDLTSVRLSSNATTIAANAFKLSSALATIRFDGWYDLATENKAIGNWADKTCRFIVPGDNATWLGFIATTQYVEPWDSLSASVQDEYRVRYGEDAHLIPVGLTVSGATAVKRTWIVKTDAVVTTSSIEVVAPSVEFGTVTRNPAPAQDGTYAPGTSVTVTFTPTEGVTFHRWNGDVAAEDAQNLSVTVVAQGLKTLSPDFTANFLVYKNGKLTDNVEIINAKGDANAIVITGCERYNNGAMDLSKPIYGGGKIIGIAEGIFMNNAFTGGRLLLPETLENIGSRAFDCCNTLTNVTPLFPNLIRTLGYSCLAMTPNLKGNLSIGFGKEANGNPIIVTFSRTNTDETNSARTFQQARLGPLVRIGPGVVSVPTGLLQFSQSATNIWISAGTATVETKAFRRLQRCDVVFEGDLPNVVADSFDSGPDRVDGDYTYRQRYYATKVGRKWRAFLTNTEKVKPWGALTAAERELYFTKFPTEPRTAHPYGLTLGGVGLALPANQWVFAPFHPGTLLRVR